MSVENEGRTAEEVQVGCMGQYRRQDMRSRRLQVMNGWILVREHVIARFDMTSMSIV